MSILNQIDDTLDDWRGSNDAMRWRPEAVDAPSPTEKTATNSSHLTFGTSMWLDRQAQPLTSAEANRLLGDWDYKTVGRTNITSSTDPTIKLFVSTVWLGINHAFFGGPPILFETMVFGDDSEHDQRQWRWGTEAQALAGHAQVVAQVAASVPDFILADPDVATVDREFERVIRRQVLAAFGVTARQVGLEGRSFLDARYHRRQRNRRRRR